MTEFKTEQEKLWAGAFGNDYVDRNKDQELISANLVLFSRAFARTEPFKSLIEFGSNIGMNLRALKTLLPNIELSSIEINAKAVAQVKEWNPNLKVYHQSILEFTPDYQREMVLIKGVLIHINPEMLPAVYDKLYATSKRYVCIIEYFNTTPVTVSYRGQENALFKRDFAGEMLDRFPDLRLVDYGFAYHRDYLCPQGDSNWFLLEKRSK